jgi:hypothetical protein
MLLCIQNDELPEKDEEAVPKRKRMGHFKRARRVDKVSRIVFPVAYVTFNIIFWSVYLSK